VDAEKAGFASEEKMFLHLMKLLKDRVGVQHSISIQPRPSRPRASSSAAVLVKAASPEDRW
jgi:hypothetical protein